MKHDEQVEMKLYELLANRPPEVSGLAIELRRVIASLAPTSSELLYDTYAVSNVFTYTAKLGQAFIHIATYSEHVNLGFNQGSKLEDPNELLQGAGKLIRHIRLDSIDMVNNNLTKKIILASIELGRQMAVESGGVKSQHFALKTK